jgi:hypothetical protein
MNKYNLLATEAFKIQSRIDYYKNEISTLEEWLEKVQKDMKDMNEGL